MENEIDRSDNRSGNCHETHDQHANIHRAMLGGPGYFSKLLKAFNEILLNFIGGHEILKVPILKKRPSRVLSYRILVFPAREFSDILI